MIESKAVVTITDGEIIAIFPYDGTNDTGREARKGQALVEAVNFLGYDIPATGRTGNGTIYRSENHEIGLLSSGPTVRVGDFL